MAKIERERGPAKFAGHAGEFAVMAELSARGYNVASPAVDIGDDVFAVNEDTGRLDRIQVKTARVHWRSSSNRIRQYDFMILGSRLGERLAKAGGDTIFIFVLLSPDYPRSWSFVILKRAVLEYMMRTHHVGGNPTSARGSIMFTIEYVLADGRLSFLCRGGGRLRLDDYVNNWDEMWPPLGRYQATEGEEVGEMALAVREQSTLRGH